MATASYLYWSSRGRYSEGRRWFDRLLERDRGRGEADRVLSLYADSALADM
ncbi:hypothetical protein [Nocardia sp. NPDC059239]|uniref:hypothetical protein n=1 Tax=unclassified Nocardia TaxID=2637762 RepID=UPI0036B9850C